MIKTITTVAPKMNFTDIVQNYRKRLLGFIQKRVRNLSDAEDILQDVFYQLIESERLMKPIDQLTAWMYTVTRNKITDHYRKSRPELISEFETDDYEDLDFIDFLANSLSDTRKNSPEDEYFNSVIWSEFLIALNELPEEQKMVFELNEMQGISFKEISEQTNTPINTLISRKRYAVLYLRERLNDLYNEFLNLK